MAHPSIEDSGIDATPVITAGIHHQPTELLSEEDNCKPETKFEASDRSASDVEAAKEGLQNSDGGADSEHDERPKGLRFALLFSCLLLGNLFVGYDSSCIVTLTPVITDQFHALDDLGWYSVAFLLAQSATMLIYGQLYSIYSMKHMYILSCAVFIVGSILCAAAPTSPGFIVGRALSGLGAAGVFAGINIILAHTTSLEHRSVYFAICGGVECFALAFGPLLSGAIAHYSTWRVSFWIVVPVSAVAITLLLISVGSLRATAKPQLSTSDRLKRLDLLGFAINVPMTICFVLGLVWAGTSYQWSNWRIIVLFVIAAALFAAFLFAEYKAGEDGMVPYKMLRQRTAAFATLITFCNFASLSVVSYYLPIYFQAIRGASTLSSGLMYLPLAVSMAVTALAGGPLTAFVGYCNPGLIIGGVLMSVGAGLLTTLGPSTSAAKWIIFQIVYGIGVGLAFQPPFIAVQAALPEKMVPKVLVVLSFSQQLGGIVILTIAQNVFLTGLVHRLAAIVPGMNSQTLLNNGALGVIDTVPPALRDDAIIVYNAAIRRVLYISLGLACFVAICSVGVEWKPVKKNENKNETVGTPPGIT